MALTEITCPECDGSGLTWAWYGQETCERCWGAKVVEKQYGPQNTGYEVPDSANLARDRAIFARWEQDRERQG